MPTNPPLSSILGMPVITSKHVPEGQFLIIDRMIYTRLNMDQLVLKIWIGDAIRAAKAHLAALVAAAESRLFDAVSGASGVL